mgnify:CR=1 FL=1
MLNGPTHLPTDKITSAVVFLHGYGSDGDDLIELAPSFAADLPKTAFFAPHAPQKTAMGVGRQWFSDAEGTFRDKPGLDAATDALSAYLEETVYQPYNLKPKDVVLVGFSMGTMTALHAAPRLPGGCAGVVGFSGALMFPEALPEDLTTRLKTMPFLLIHGREDDVVPFHATELAAQALEKEGFDVQMQLLNDLGHGIDGRGIRQCLAFLKQCL